VVAFVDDEGAGRLRALLQPAIVLDRARTIPEVAGTLRHGGVTACIVDPSALSADAVAALCAATAAAAVSLVLYTSGIRDCSHRVLECLALRSVELLFWDAHDERSVLLRVTRRGGELSVLALIARALLPNWRRLPPDELAVVVRFVGMRQIPRPEGFFSVCLGARRTVERAFVRAGIPSVATFLSALRLASAWDGLQREPTLEAASSRFGYGSTRTLEAHFVTLTGFTPRRAQAEMSTATLVDRLAHSVRGSPGPV
jgi:hypothetical protein